MEKLPAGRLKQKFGEKERKRTKSPFKIEIIVKERKREIKTKQETKERKWQRDQHLDQ